MNKKLSIVYLLAFLFFVLLGGWFFLYYYFTIGDTWGLKNKLGKLPGVNSVANYMAYEGNAFVSLQLDGGGLLVLGSIGNADLLSSDGIMLEQVGSNKIFCKDNSGLTGSVGVNIKAVENQHLENINLKNIPDVVTNYKILDDLFSKMPLTFIFEGNEWTCRKNRTPYRKATP